MLFMNRHTKRRTEVRFIMKKIVKTIIMILLMVAVGAVHAYGQWKQPVYDTTVDAAEYQNVGEISGTAKIEQ